MQYQLAQIKWEPVDDEIVKNDSIDTIFAIKDERERLPTFLEKEHHIRQMI